MKTQFYRWASLFFIILFGINFFLIKNKEKEQLSAPLQYIPQAGKDYIVLNHSEINSKQVPQTKIKVIWFFNYYCQICYTINPLLKDWVNKKTHIIQFEKIPVSFEDPSWKLSSEIYYLMRLLGNHLEDKIFKLIYEQEKDLTDPKTIQTFLLNEGITPRVSQTVFDFKTDTQLLRAEKITESYHIDAVPTIVIGNRYKLDPSMTKSIDHFFQTAEYLIQQLNSEKSK